MVRVPLFTGLTCSGQTSGGDHYTVHVNKQHILVKPSHKNSFSTNTTTPAGHKGIQFRSQRTQEQNPTPSATFLAPDPVGNFVQ